MVLQCSATVLKEQLKLCLAAEGFGNRLCFLEPTSNAQVCAGQRERGSDEQRGWDLKKGVWGGGGSGEGVLSPRGKGARSGVGGGLKREGRGLESLQSKAEGPGASGGASRGLTREGAGG